MSSLLAQVTLKRTSRVTGGHLWIFSNEIVEGLKNYRPGSLVKVFGRDKSFYGIGYINPHSLIAVRLLSRVDETIDIDFFRQKIQNALSYRRRFLRDLTAYRLIYSEGDLLPGVIVDIYGTIAVVQILTLGMENLKGLLIDAIKELINPEVIVLRNDSPVRELEGLQLYKEVVKGKINCPVRMKELGIILAIDPLQGQKTGAFLDQRFNRAEFSSLITKGSRGLDLFCYTGSWGLHALKSGASEVTFVDSSKSALQLVESNWHLNGSKGRAEFVRADVFEFLKQQSHRGLYYDFIVLDPPAFVKGKTHLKEGIKAYVELNSLSMGLLKKGGIIASSSCSHHISRSQFFEILQRAARQQGRLLRMLAYRTQPIDHPVLINVPETEYLKCVFAEVL